MCEISQCNYWQRWHEPDTPAETPETWSQTWSCQPGQVKFYTCLTFGRRSSQICRTIFKRSLRMCLWLKVKAGWFAASVKRSKSSSKKLFDRSLEFGRFGSKQVRRVLNKTPEQRVLDEFNRDKYTFNLLRVTSLWTFVKECKTVTSLALFSSSRR